MSLHRVCEEVVRPFLASTETPDINARLKTIEEQLRLSGVLVPVIAAGLEPEDLKGLGLPVPVLRQLVKAIHEDNLPRAEISNDPHGLRPLSFDQVVGHSSFKQLMMRSILASRRRGEPMRHILLTGPRGLGKTTLSLSIAHECGVNVHLLNGSQFRTAMDASTQVLKWEDGDIIFIDEIHGMGKLAQETLYSVMEDQRLPVTEKRRGGSVITSVPAPKVTVIGATTNPAKMLQPFRNRFGQQYTLSFYSEGEMVQIGRRSCQVLKFRLPDEALVTLVRHSRDNPRTLNAFLIQLSDQSVAEDRKDLNAEDVRFLMELSGFDKDGLRPFERTYLEVLERLGGKAGIKTLASAMDMELSEVEETVEPWLVREGWVAKTSRGRVLNRPLELPDPETDISAEPVFDEIYDDEADTEPLLETPPSSTNPPQLSLQASGSAGRCA